MKENIIQQKSYEFSKKIVIFYFAIRKKYHEYTITKQLLRSWTSISANISESISWQSWRDFLHELSIAYKETSETKYRLQLIQDTDIFPDDKDSIQQLLDDCEEVRRILTAIIKTLKQKDKTSYFLIVW